MHSIFASSSMMVVILASIALLFSQRNDCSDDKD